MLYYRNKLFVDCGYAKLKSLLSDYLAHLHFYSGDDREDDLRKHPVRWPPNSELSEPFHPCSVIVYPSKSAYSLIGSGILITLLHYRHALQTGHIDRAYVPLSILSRMRNFPNAIEIEAHNYFPYDGFVFSRDFALWLTKSNRRVFMLSVDQEVFNISHNPLLSDERKLRRLGAYLLSFSDPKRLLQSKELAKSRLGDRWSGLHRDTRQFLTTAIHLYQLYDDEGANVCIDASPISIALAKSVENELKHRFLLPYRNYFLSHQTTYGAKKELAGSAKIVRFLSSKRSKSPEMGTFAYFLNTVINNEKSRSGGSIIQSFRDFAFQRSNPKFFLEPAGLLADLQTITTRFRNPVAHTDPITFASATSFMRLVIGQDANSLGFIHRLVDSS